jgi:hypothetical protein
MLDVISPCVTFNDHEGSTKSYKYMQEHEERSAKSASSVCVNFEEIDVEYDPGTTLDVTMHDGSNIVDEPLATLPESMTRPGTAALDAAMEELR